MGLDITAISKARHVPQCTADGCSPYHQRVTIEASMVAQADGLQAGACYRVDDGGLTMQFRAGSYSGYNAWREWLCQLALNVSPENVWANPELYAGKPFVELINFSDCEGTIGPQTATKLHADFVEYRNQAKQSTDERGYYYDVYEKWLKAFEIASDGGLVRFH